MVRDFAVAGVDIDEFQFPIGRVGKRLPQNAGPIADAAVIGRRQWRHEQNERFFGHDLWLNLKRRLRGDISRRFTNFFAFR